MYIQKSKISKIYIITKCTLGYITIWNLISHKTAQRIAEGVVQKNLKKWIFFVFWFVKQAKIKFTSSNEYSSY